MSIALSEFGAYFDQINYDLLIMLGDRYEMLSVAIAAAMYNIPILHIHGGEATYGNYDEFIRHSITKMSRFHFTASEEYRERVIQLGENPEYVFNMGALGAENCLTIDKSKVERTVRQLSICRYFVVLFHPETLTSNSAECQICNLLKAIERFPQYFFVFIGSNADTHSEVIRKHIQFFIGRHDNAIYYENLNSDSYHYLLQQSLGLIGNSSSGIIEAPSLGIYTVNIGERQRGRIRGNSVLDVVCSCEEIAWAIETVINKKRPLKVCNPYYKKGALENYLRKTKEILNKVEDIRKKPKEFYDLAMKN